jgi:hypothetical protein
MKQMNSRLRLLSIWLKEAESEIDSYTDGKLESSIKYAKKEVKQEIGDYLEEILNLDDESIDKFLKEEQIRKENKNKLPF